MGIFAEMKEDQHCTEHLATNADGESIEALSEHAVKWCALGWVLKKTYHLDLEYGYAMIAMKRFAKGLGFVSVEEANDGLGWEFIQALKRAGI